MAYNMYIGVRSPTEWQLVVLDVRKKTKLMTYSRKNASGVPPKNV